RNRLCRRSFQPESLGEPLPEDLAHLGAEAHRNLVVYSGFDPFVGSGVRLNGWSFAVDIRQGKEVAGVRSDPHPFTLSELSESADCALGNLNLSRLNVEDRVYVSGLDVRDDPRFLENPLGRPAGAVDEALIQQSILNPSMRIRHYRCVRLVDWSGELVLSYYF